MRVLVVPSTSEFELGLLTHDCASANIGALPALVTGLESSTLIQLDSREDMRAAVNRIAAGANRMMSMFAPNLEPELFDQTPFLDIAKRFVLARNFVKIRVLVADNRRLGRDGNRFVAMARRLGSYIEMRMMHAPAEQRAASYLIADDRALAMRARTDSWSGLADFSTPANARILLNEFDIAWQANVPEDELRVATR